MSPLDDLSIDFIQTGGGIAAKLKTDMTVSRHSYPLTTLYTISFKIPKVKKRMTAALKFRQKNADVDYGMIQMIIYPPEDKAVTGRAINQKLLENNMPCITVSDGHESHHVANFLAYRKANLSWVETASQPDTLTLVETTAKELKNLPSAASDRARVIVFVSDSDLPPGVYTTLTASGGALTKVTLPILSDLETNPRSCEIFLDLINQHLSRVMIVEN
ncbi:MAG: hypothetical protein LBK60_01935 [Verrucomicrobiales bacterium]|nr:hypothetical protein [Verrucomicrobiales bacterium]